MANEQIPMTILDDSSAIMLSIAGDASAISASVEDRDPYYVGAEAKVEQITGGARVTCKDKSGTTTAVIHDGQKGDKGDTGDLPMYFGTTAEWAERTSLVSEKNAFYVWTDYKQVDGENIAGMKLGDGLAYVLDLPFLDAQFQSHAADTDIHVTSAEKAFWNAKNRGFVTDETLILTDL